MLKNYDNFFLPAADLEKGREFYQKTLGLAVKFDFSAYGLLAFNVGDEEPAIILRSHPGVKPSILFEVDDVRATYAELKAKGVVFLADPYEINTGLAAEFEDPFGNRLGITDYSKRPDLARNAKISEES
ncbi:MAG TPA: VOC family protein [Ktedonobacteraceae bacterium]|nr:VOC family protein [Ktedonobacteraceae bacterium]